MFDSLSERLGATLDGLRGKGRLSEDDINAAMREIRLALLEADVNFGVVRQFVAKVKERAMGSEVMDSLTPGQQVIKIVHEELTELMGTAGSGLSFSNRPPTVVLMAGLQGSGKTTACGKLARVRDEAKPHDVLLVLDAMTGQEAVNVAQSFQERIAFDGVVLTKLDGDARGGAALSVKAVTGKPIKLASTGEKLDQLETFHPDRLASRILGMGDVLSLIERAQEQVDEQEAKDLEAKLRKAEFNLDDFLNMMRQVRKMSQGTGLSGLLGMLPGVGRQIKQLKNADLDERQLDRVEAIILSMTPSERRNPRMIDGSRRRRIAAGSGTNVQTVNQMLGQFKQTQRMMKQVGRGKMPQFPGLQRR